MNPICVFYHCIITGGERNIDTDYALNLVASQMSALTKSGLADAASAIYICVNGSESDAMAVASMVPNKAQVIHHGSASRTEIPTLNILRDWVQTHKDWYVLYHHTKGVSTPNQADGWRRRMEGYCVYSWTRCVQSLTEGAEVCGCHWLTPEQHGKNVIGSPFYGGNFWWSRGTYLATLPPLPEPTWANRYEAEVWIGRGPKRPRVVDFCPGWPTP
jgi:hypothetical protein